MNKIISLIFSVLYLNVITLSAQITVEELNHRLDTEPFFGFRVDYMSNLTLPDSVKEKFLTALSGNFTPRLRERMLIFEPWQKESFLEQSKLRCNGDSICIEQTFREIIANVMEANYRSYMNRPISGQLVLAAGSWNIKEAIPILENAMGNRRYGQRTVQMALVKLGNDSIKQLLLERYTLSYVLQTTPLDTINDNVRTRANTWTTREAIHTAMYLQSKEILLNILDLIYIRGLTMFCFGGSCSYVPIISLFILDFGDSFCFRKFSNVEKLREIYEDYAFAIWRLEENKRRNRREQRELDRLLSTEYRTMIKNQIRDWIIENVNFE